MEMLGSRGGPSTEPVPTERDVVYKAYSAKDGMVSSEIQTMTWHLFRPAADDTPFSSRQMLEKTATCPAVYQLWNDAESVRPLAYYIEGQTSGIVFDCLQTPTSAQNLKEYIDKNFATKPYIVVVGHEHGDHDAQVQNFLQAGVPVYVNQRAWGSIGTPGAFGAVIPDPKDQAKVMNVDEGDSFDLGGCKFDVYALTGHANGLLILNDKVNGLVFSTDIYGCTRAGSADNVAVSGIKADMLLSMAQQCHANYLKDGGKVTMLFTGHDESPLNENNLFLYEAALQQVIDNGDKGCMPTLRGGTDAVYSRTTMIGDMWKDNTDWISLKLAGKLGDNTEYLTKNDQFNYNGKDGYLKYSVLSNIVIKGGELVGTKLEWAPPITFKWAGKDMTVENALPNKFNPWVYDYTIKVAAGTSEITIQPITMSTKVTSIKLNGQEVAYASENKVSVIDGTIITIEITAPDKTTKSTYTFTVDVA